MKANADVYLDNRTKKDGQCTVKIKITHNRKRKYFSTDISLTPDEFENIMQSKRRTKQQKQVYNKITHYLNKDNEVINKLDVFTFAKFKDGYFDKRDVNKSVSYAFDKYIEGLKLENRLGTAESYLCAK